MLHISLNPSRLLAAILITAHAGAIGLILNVELPQWVKFAAAVGLVIQCIIVVYRDALLRGAKPIIALEVTSDHGINIQTRRGGWQECKVLGSTYVTPFLTIMNLRLSGERMARHVTLLPDSLDRDEFRRLRVWLKWKNDSVKS